MCTMLGFANAGVIPNGEPKRCPLSAGWPEFPFGTAEKFGSISF